MVDAKTGKEVSSDEVQRGFESKDVYVLLEPEDLQRPTRIPRR
jgi:non-homologous end joining protein Ku